MNLRKHLHEAFLEGEVLVEYHRQTLGCNFFQTFGV